MRGIASGELTLADSHTGRASWSAALALFEQQNRYRVVGSRFSDLGGASEAPRTRSSNSSRDANKRAAATTIRDSRSPHAAAIDRRRSESENYRVYIKKEGELKRRE